MYDSTSETEKKSIPPAQDNKLNDTEAMDQRQKDLISSMANELAESVMATEFAEYLQEYDLVDKDKVDDIMSRIEGNFCRNLKLIYAAQDSDSPMAYRKFVKVLERVDPSNVSKLVAFDDKVQTREGSRSMLGKMFDKFSSNSNLPLGLSSSLSSSQATQSYYSPTTSSVDYRTSQNSSIVSSPFKEKHQATLVCSTSSSNSEQNSSDTLQGQQSMTDSGYRLTRRLPDGQLPVTPSGGGQRGRGVIEGGDRGNSRQINMNKFSQTPTRSSDLNFMNNLSLAEEDEELPEEPLVAWHPYAQNLNQESASGASSPHRCIPSCSSASSESGESTSDSLIDPNLTLNPDVMSAIARDVPNMMTVKKATVCHNNLEMNYKMTARPRGNCLIVNNINFEDDIFPTRKGSDEDANRFDQIFRQLGFETIMTRNLTADQMRDKFKELSAACRPEHDAVFVFILSHGSEHGIYGTDGLEVYLDSEVISCFDNRNCKAMIGKPKVIVIQACRGRAKDCGVSGEMTDSIACTPNSPVVRPDTSSQENRVPESWLRQQPPDGKKRRLPRRSDILLVFSCLAGFVSVRNETAGSWLGVALAYFIMTHAHELDLQTILNFVSGDINQRESSNGHTQTIDVQLMGWRKKLYFNPGINMTFLLTSANETIEIRRANEDDASKLYELLIESTCGRTEMTQQNLRDDLAREHKLSDLDKFKTQNDPTIALDPRLAMPNCSVCQAMLAYKDGDPIGHVLFHYYYTPWHGRYAFIDDIYVRDVHRRKGVATSLLRQVSAMPERQNLVGLMFSSTRMDDQLLRTALNHRHHVVRSDHTDWSVYRVDFNKQIRQMGDEQKIELARGVTS